MTNKCYVIVKIGSIFDCGSNHNYLNYNTKLDTYYLGDMHEDDLVKTKFTFDEIREFKHKYPDEAKFFFKIPAIKGKK